MKKFTLMCAMILALTAVAVANQSCRAWRTVTTTSTYTSRNDSAQTSISIQTKTVEDYQGKKK